MVQTGTFAKRTAAALGPALAVCLLATGALADIRIAVVGPMSGQFSVLGEQMRLGAAYAVADINAAGGIRGETVVLETGDDRCEPKDAAAVANRMVGRNVVAVIGHLCSAPSIEASNVYSSAAVIQISPASASPAFTDNRPDPTGGTYRLYAREDDQPKIAGRFLAERFGDGRVAFIHDNTTYGKTLSDNAMAAFEDGGGRAVYNQGFESGQTDYSGIVGQLEIQNVDAVYIGGYPADVGRVVRQMRRIGMDAAVMGGDALLTTDYRDAAGRAAEGTFVTYPASPRSGPGADALIRRLRADGKEPEAFTMYAYAAVQVWAEATRRAGTSAYGAVADAINEGRFETVVGVVSFDARGDMDLPGYSIFQWRDGWYEKLPDPD
ncbi:MAG TPA: branched-chain amino acid ABC transporter substrate-binding protein [Afifellaceae bacterium]|nr:branched-chain amino acid ABC transporter substrate-binding protein [Afifellaceae bacterium]